jgi:hypothetical protein
MDAAAEEVIRAELERTRGEARLSIYRGIAMIAVVPLVVIGAAIAAFALGGFGAFLAFLIAASYTLIGSVAGLASILGGIADHRRCARELRGLDEMRRLPEARLLR